MVSEEPSVSVCQDKEKMIYHKNLHPYLNSQAIRFIPRWAASAFLTIGSVFGIFKQLQRLYLLVFLRYGIFQRCNLQRPKCIQMNQIWLVVLQAKNAKIDAIRRIEDDWWLWPHEHNEQSWGDYQSWKLRKKIQGGKIHLAGWAVPINKSRWLWN